MKSIIKYKNASFLIRSQLCQLGYQKRGVLFCQYIHVQFYQKFTDCFVEIGEDDYGWRKLA